MEKINWMDFKGEKNPISESYRAINANLQAVMGKDIKLLEVTSFKDHTGKSIVIAGLAITLAQARKKVLMIDMDFYASAQHFLFNLPNYGLTDGIASNLDLNEMVQHCMELDHLDIITSGSVTLVSSEILGSDVLQQFLVKARKEYDFILLDVPSIETTVDALVIAPNTDGVLLVVNSGEDKQNSLVEAKTKLEKAGGKVLGCILNKVKDKT